MVFEGHELDTPRQWDETGSGSDNKPCQRHTASAPFDTNLQEEPAVRRQAVYDGTKKDYAHDGCTKGYR